MFNYLWKKFFYLRKITYLKKRILSLKEKIELLTDEEIKSFFFSLHLKFKKTEKREKEKLLEKKLVIVFALVREIIYRKLGVLLFPTQIFGAIVLYYSNIAQMNTGEGKTLTAILPICLNSLLDRKNFIITVNEYLVVRDWKTAKPIFDFFNISSNVNLGNYTVEEKNFLFNNYVVIYSTSSELVFDYLKENLIMDGKKRKKFEFYFAIIDEIDSVLIDEAQNPLIISRRDISKNIIPSEYEKVTKLTNLLSKEIDYVVNESEKDIWLTNDGIEKSEKILNTNLFSQNNYYNFLLHNALRAKYFYHRDVEYIVDTKKKKIIPIDELTGRLVANRVFGGGIQQAIESKENINISPKNTTIATITYQNFFRLFTKLSGMTGTALEEEEEFRDTYGMEVIVIKPYKKLIRKDENDLIFINKEKKYQAIIELVKKNQKTKKRPILIGSPDVEVSEYLSSIFNKENIIHSKLNAINHEKEAEIIAEAGKIGSVTISTNMAGRGTDIVLDKESLKVGGLLVIGVERNTSRRIDNQLIGRSGRQGNPGQSIFFISLEDDLIKNFKIKENINNFISQKQLSELFHHPLTGKTFNFISTEPQENIRRIHSANRQFSLNYDLIINKQRKKIYNFRQKVLTNHDPIELITKRKYDTKKKEVIRTEMLIKIDFFWSSYLECLDKIREIIKVKRWLFEDEQEIFSQKTTKLFKEGIQKLENELKKIISQF